MHEPITCFDFSVEAQAYDKILKLPPGRLLLVAPVREGRLVGAEHDRRSSGAELGEGGGSIDAGCGEEMEQTRNPCSVQLERENGQLAEKKENRAQPFIGRSRREKGESEVR